MRCVGRQVCREGTIVLASYLKPYYCAGFVFASYLHTIVLASYLHASYLHTIVLASYLLHTGFILRRVGRK